MEITNVDSKIHIIKKLIYLILIIDYHFDHSVLQGPSVELQGDEKHGE